jgi:hypothetical protein
MTAPAGAAYPIAVSYEPPERIARWRALFSFIVLIPHVIVYYVLSLVAGVLTFVAWFAILFTGKLPEGMAQLPRAALRYSARMMFYGVWLTGAYPPFTWDNQEMDPGNVEGLRVDIRTQYEGRNRLTTFFRYVMLIPHMICIAVLGIVMYFCLIAGFFTVLFTAKFPAGIRDFVVKVMKWNVRVQGYAVLLTDEYPPFSLEA